ncbi:MAG TPA: hypothetical protein VLG47_02100, partial [Candidatus Saccharimonadales bacterium]|nr:hypothetical protein [Candidatus Saccharimonadales bacterium]
MGETHPGVVTTIGYNALPDFEYSDEPHEYLFQRLSSIVARGELALVQALQSPELQWALMAVYPHNPLLRERDYPAKDRTAKYQPVSRNLSRVYMQEQTSTMDAVRMAHDAHESVVQWYSFFNSGPTGFLEPGGIETVNDWRRIADHLHASPS